MTEERRLSKNKPCSPELLAILSCNIKKLREERNLSQEKLAEKAKMHRTFISLIERRGRNVTLGVIESLAHALDVDVATLITDNSEKKGEI
ncbi:helix-turn-helix domain-containing protein [Chromohalobacter marismortui]|uniref:helix-turn-helix domain-containing protein n=1 Tax=Chromohalobacter marismortui TaxID=42055 RepID=UPI001AAEEA82|nr:helix-turn-helix transcriptional regulator [Chromohalobacter marismortui]